MAINYWAVLVCGVLSMVIGFIWYGPVFGKTWMKVVGATTKDVAARKEMQKRAGPLYLVQFLLTLFQLWILAYYIVHMLNVAGTVNAIWIWAAFIMPTIAGSSMWNNDSAKVAWTRFGIQAGYQLIMFIIYGLILSAWR